VRDTDRQQLAFGKEGHESLQLHSVAVVGISGGGSHVCQQLVHAGVGRLAPVDDEIIEETNLRRVVGAIAADVATKTKKVDVIVRMAATVRPSVVIDPVPSHFPDRVSIEVLSRVDMIIGCVDDDAARNDLNNFALERRIPYVDVGATIMPHESKLGFRAYGQVICVWPGGPCLRCIGLIFDVSIAEAHRRQTGYMTGSNDPQVVSINGTLASEAVTVALLYLTIGHHQPSYRRYTLPPGRLIEPTVTVDVPCAYCGFSGRIRSANPAV
jgi:molybdopterin/thiamine biosynthesis adenylyltransferase